MTEVETTFALLLLFLKGRNQRKLLAAFIQRIVTVLQMCGFCLSFENSVTLFHPTCDNSPGGCCVLADVHWFHSCLGEPLQEHPGPVRRRGHGALQQTPHGRDGASHLRRGQRVLPLPLEAPRQPVHPHQVSAASCCCCCCCCFGYPWCWAFQGDLGARLWALWRELQKRGFTKAQFQGGSELALCHSAYL